MGSPERRRAFVLTFLLFRLIQEDFQAVGWNSERDSSGDLHGVDPNNFPILITQEERQAGNGNRKTSRAVKCCAINQ